MFWNDWNNRDVWDEFNDLFSWTTTPRTSNEFPPVNIWLGENQATILAKVPGMDPKEIDISVSGEALTIKGNRNPYELKKDEEFHRQERSYGAFTRTVTLPFRAEVNSIDAHFDNGILKISVPRAEADKPKKISVKG